MSTQWLLDKMAANSNEVAIINSHEQITYGDILNVALNKYDTSGISNFALPNVSSYSIAGLLVCAEKQIPIYLTTSGTTGESQTVYHQIEDLIAPYEGKDLRKQRMVIYLMVNHMGGLNTILRSLVSCGTLIIPDERSVDGVCRAIEEYKAEVLPTTPSFLNVLLTTGAHRAYDLSSLKVISFGTEVMPEALMTKLQSVFPKMKWIQTYGLTEVGVLQTRTHPTNPLYIQFPEANVWVSGGTLWVNGKDTGDMVESWFDMENTKQTWLRITGRKSDIINVGGEKVYPSDVEEILMRMDGVKDVACYGERNELLGNIVVAKFNLKKGVDATDWKHKVLEYCEKEKMDKSKRPVKVIVTTDELIGVRGKKVRR